MQRYKIDNMVFRSRKAVYEYAQTILTKHSNYGKRTKITGLGEISFLTALFARHPNRSQKASSDALTFFVDLHPGYPTYCFFVQSADGPLMDFSIQSCLKPKSDNQYLTEALRNEIREDIQQAKLNFIREENLSFEHPVAHHQNITFAQLVNLWLKNENRSETEFEIVWDQADLPTLKDRDAADRWIQFHHLYADLQIVEASEHSKEFHPRIQKGKFINLRTINE